MSNRTNPNFGPRSGGEAPKRARQMTVYDRLEDARKRRRELLAKGDGPDPRPLAIHRASNETTTPTQRAAPPVPPPETIAEPLAPVIAETPARNIHLKPTRNAGGYWMGLAQAMAAVVMIAVLIAVFRPFGNEPELQPIAAAPLTPEPAVSAPTVPEPIAAIEPAVPDISVTTTGPNQLVALEPTALGLTIAPLISPSFEVVRTSLNTSEPDEIPFVLNPNGAPISPLSTAPVALTTTPPIRPTTQTAPANPQLAEATNVVLLVPDYVPQENAENAIAAAAALGIPVDQTRRATVSISRTNIRYYHEEDAEAATILASGIGGIARDFTDFTPPPSPGVIEVWLEGRGGSSSNRGSATARGIEADLAALRNSIARALSAATGN
ncbi:MAG: hypothetical protein HKP37_08805 [Boseongicola sp.]|nr:hypothetical protein [Boseongicola sp.]NNL18822.1 hypothetical protein [Boseongicola sp.]